MPTTSTASRSQPAKLVTSGAAWPRPSLSISSNWTRADLLAVPDDHLALEDRHANRGDRLGRPIARLRGELLAERRVGHEQRADQLGSQHPLGLVEPTGHPPRQPAPGVGHLAVAELGALGRVEDAGRLGADDRPARGVEPDQRLARRARQVGDRGLEQGRPAGVRQLGREGRVDLEDPSLEGELLLGGDRDRVLGRVVVLRLDGLAGRGLGVGGLDLALEVDGARRQDVPGGQVADGDIERLLRQDVGTEDRPPGRRSGSRRRWPGGSRHCARSLPWRRWTGSASGSHRPAQPRAPSCAARSALASAWATSSLTCLPSARPAGPWRQPAHDLAHVARRRGAGGLDRLADELARPATSVQGLGQVLAQDRDLALFLRREVLAATAAERLDRLAPGLDLARQDGQELVLGERPAIALLGVMGGARRHARGRHGAARHRRAWRWRCRSGCVAEATPVWHLGLGGSPLVAASRPWNPRGQGLGGGRRPAQPTCVRAFFLRLASLRLRFTDGFS